MVDYISMRKRRNNLSRLFHIFLNLSFAVVSTLVTAISGSVFFGLVLVLVAKWRVFAVRPRYWWPGLKANAVDIIVSFSVIYLTYSSCATSSINIFINPFFYILTIFYILWLLVIKPKTSEKASEWQAFLAIFLGSYATALATSSEFFGVTLFSLSAFIIGYCSLRHIIIQAEHDDSTLIMASLGLILAELAWAMIHWMRVYTISLSFLPSFRLPQFSLAATLISFYFIRGYKSYLRHDNKICADDIVMPAIFTVVIILIMIIFFSNLAFTH